MTSRLFTKRDTTANQVQPDFSWIDEYMANVRPYIHVRLEDNLLIKRPNQAVKLNPTGARILVELLQGKPIKKLLKKIGSSREKINQINAFLHAVRAQIDGSLDEFSCNPAVDIQPFDMKFAEFPVLSEIALTYRCNLRCKFCYAGCNCTQNPSSSQREMTPRQVKKILNTLVDQARVPSVSFTGGEPTLFPRLKEMVQHAKQIGMRVNLITNGTMVDKRMARQLADHGLDSAQVSLEGVSPDTHDRIVQQPGAFFKTLAGIHNLIEAGISTHTNTTMVSENLAECVEMAAFVKKRLVTGKFSMNLIIPAGSGAVNEKILVTYKETASILPRIIEASEDAGVEFMWYSPIPMCIFNPLAQGLGNKGCSACDGLISIAANGDVLPCSSYPDPVGNLLNESFQKVWDSQKAKQYRQKDLAHPQCKNCENFAACNGACPLYWQHQGYGELHEFTSVRGLEKKNEVKSGGQESDFQIQSKGVIEYGQTIS